jgi:hypothetical protein
MPGSAPGSLGAGYRAPGARHREIGRPRPCGCPVGRDTVRSGADNADGYKALHAREHTDSSSVGEVGRDLRGRKGVRGGVPLGTTLAAVREPRIVFSAHGFYGKNHPRRPQLRGLLTTEKPGMKRASRCRTTAVSSAVPSAGTQTPLPPRKSRPTSPTQDESVCSRACRDLDSFTLFRALSLLAGHPLYGHDCLNRWRRWHGGRSSGAAGSGRPGETGCPSRADKARYRRWHRVALTQWVSCQKGQVKVPARTGTYRLIRRRRSGTRLPWSQGRPWWCPAGNDTGRRARAACRFFLSWVL